MAKPKRHASDALAIYRRLIGDATGVAGYLRSEGRHNTFVFLGSIDWPELDDWDTTLPASADARHVAIKTRGQIGHTRVSFWSGAMPLFGEAVFDGDLDLHDARICVSDLEYTNQWIKRVGQSAFSARGR